MTKYNTYTLENGLRIIHLPSDSQVVYCGYQIAAGTRDEEPGEEGLAHFCEHMAFKGTERRNALQVINYLEQLGGDLNAFTNKEDTTYYAAIQKEHFAKAVDLLTDIVFHSQYPQHEIDKEVEVICDEIESYNDSPAELIYDEFENILFEGHPLGHNILGQAEQLRTYTTADALRFVRRHYRPENAIFFAYGDVDFGRLVSSLKFLAEPSGEAERRAPLPPLMSGRVIERTLGTHQSHVMLGTRGYDIHHPLRIPLYLINNILGGPGMNARLNLSLRERHGLVYTVESTMASYSDTGVWSIYFGCDPHDVNKCLRLVRHELDRVMQKPLSDRQLKAAKQQLKGQIAIACDNREQFALDFGKSFLHYGWEKDINNLFAKIDKVTAEDIQKVANELFATERLTTLIFR
ncbi:MAG: insulinase family protein [Prevotella sp.]|nr:insulinase family protein [Prevotella sp.]